MKNIRVIFISHTFPPIVGGVETQNYELSEWLPKHAEVKLIANRKRWLLPLFLLYAPLRALLSYNSYDVLLLGSGILGNACWLVKKLTKKPVVIVTHGLDLTWKNKIYQKLWVKNFIPCADKLIAVGNETIRAGVEHGIPKEKFVFIPNGVDTEKHFGIHDRGELEKIIGEKIEGKKFILTSGRLAKRKGVAWFVRTVMPLLDENVVYIIAGDGPDKKNIQDAVSETKLENRIKMLGYVTDEVRDTLFNTCDIFVQPNIKVTGDLEGFGISVIEAASCQTPVIAADLEGLKDAIKNGKNGFLIEPGNAQRYAEKINSILSDNDFRIQFGKQAREYVVENYSWKIIAKNYIEEIEKVINAN